MKFESFTEHINCEIGVSEWLEVSQKRIDAFAEASGDKQWIHIDARRAANKLPYGSTIAHGFLILSLLSHLSREVFCVEDSGMRLNYGVNRVRFPAAVPAGSSIRARFGVISAKPFDKGLDVTLSATVELRGSAKPCCVAEWVLRYYRDES